jgi:hypothetical protein
VPAYGEGIYLITALELAWVDAHLTVKEGILPLPHHILLVVPVKGVNHDLRLFHFVNNPVFKIDPSRPIASIIGFERFGLPKATKWRFAGIF